MKNSIKNQIPKEDITELSKQLDLNFRKFFGQVTNKNDYQVQEKTLTYADIFSNRMLIVNAIKKGIPYQIFSLIQKIS
jgi:hypothetical protein